MWQSIVTFLSFYLYTMFCRTNVFRKKIATQFLSPWQILSNKRLSDKSRDTMIHMSQLLSNICLSSKSVDKIFSFKDAEIIVIMLRWQLQTDFKRRMNIWMKKIDFRFFSDERNEDLFTYMIMSQPLHVSLNSMLSKIQKLIADMFSWWMENITT
jgi:hypothetical protein